MTALAWLMLAVGFSLGAAVVSAYVALFAVAPRRPLRDSRQQPPQYVVWLNKRWYYWDGERFHRDSPGSGRPPDSDLALLEKMLERNGHL